MHRLGLNPPALDHTPVAPWTRQACAHGALICARAGILIALAMALLCTPLLLRKFGIFPTRGAFCAALVAWTLIAWVLGEAARSSLRRISTPPLQLAFGLAVFAVGIVDAVVLQRSFTNAWLPFLAEAFHAPMNWLYLALGAACLFLLTLPPFPPPVDRTITPIRGFTLPTPSRRATWIRAIELCLPISLQVALMLGPFLPHPLLAAAFGIPMSVALTWSLGTRLEPRKVQRHGLILVERGLWSLVAIFPVVALVPEHEIGFPSAFPLVKALIAISLLLLTLLVGFLRRHAGFVTGVDPRCLVPMILWSFLLLLGHGSLKYMGVVICTLWLIHSVGLRWALSALLLMVVGSRPDIAVVLLWLIPLIALAFAREGRLKWLALAGLVMPFAIYPALPYSLTFPAALLLWVVGWHGSLRAGAPLQRFAIPAMQCAALLLGMAAGLAIMAAWQFFASDHFQPLSWTGANVDRVRWGGYLSREFALRGTRWIPLVLLGATLTCVGGWSVRSILIAGERSPRSAMIALVTSLLAFETVCFVISGNMLSQVTLLPLAAALIVLLNARQAAAIENHAESWQPLGRMLLILAITGLLFVAQT